MGGWSCDGSSVRGRDSREEATDLARGESSRLPGRVGIEAETKDQQEFGRWKKGGKGVQGMGNNRELAALGKLKITLCSWTLGWKSRSRGEAGQHPDYAGACWPGQGGGFYSECRGKS